MKIFEKVKQNICFVIFLCAMALYYIWRLHYIAPGYDELYTYQHFIDKGVVYSMTHWPLPNNHILFSICSAILNKFMNPYIALRGISLIASIGSLILLYRCMARMMNKTVALAGCGIFASMYNVTRQAVQGRGYALSGFFLLAALTQLLNICVALTGERQERNEKYNYVLFGMCLVGGLYTNPSNLYWVIPICLAGGLFLLYTRDWRKLKYLIFASLCAAVFTVGLYSIIWSYTGASILERDVANGTFSGMRIREIILKEPFRCMKLGLKNMLSCRFIQSIGREEFWNGISVYLSELFNSFYLNKAPVVEWLLIFCTGTLTVELLMHDKKERISTLFFYCVVMILAVPLGIFVQSVLPYVRIYTYLGSVLALLFTAAYYVVIPRQWDNIFTIMAITFALVCCSSTNYNSPYDERNVEIKEALNILDTEQAKTTLTNDEFVSLNMYFYITKIKNKELDISYDQPDFMLIDNSWVNQENGITERRWFDYRTAEGLPWDWIRENMEKIYVGNFYTAYQVKK